MADTDVAMDEIQTPEIAADLVSSDPSPSPSPSPHAKKVKKEKEKKEPKEDLAKLVKGLVEARLTALKRDHDEAVAAAQPKRRKTVAAKKTVPKKVPAKKPAAKVPAKKVPVKKAVVKKVAFAPLRKVAAPAPVRKTFAHPAQYKPTPQQQRLNTMYSSIFG
jgi:hypothetical protein